MASQDRELSFALRYNVEYEYSVIGALILEPRFLDRVASKIKTEDFISPECAYIWEEALRRKNEGKPFDAIIARDLISEKVSDATEWVKTCMALCPSATNAEMHAEIIHAEARERRLRDRINEAMDSGRGDELAVEIAGICQDFISGKLGRSHSMAELMNSIVDKLELPPEGSVSTGFTRLDKLVKGMRSGNFIIIAARPSVGKSAFAQNIAENVARRGKKVILYSLEMGSDELGERWLSSNSGVELDKITDRELEDTDWKQISSACQRLYELPIIINDDPGVTTSKIRAEARTTENLGLIIIDFVTLMRSESRYDSRNLEVGAISRELKLLAMELKIPIIALAQLNRNVADTEKPGLRDLRDSGELEQNANKVIFLWNVDSENQIKGVSVAKNRQGRCGQVQMSFKGDNMRFYELLPSEEVWQRESTERKRSRWGDD